MVLWGSQDVQKFKKKIQMTSKIISARVYREIFQQMVIDNFLLGVPEAYKKDKKLHDLKKVKKF